jgi:hypothetical protein
VSAGRDRDLLGSGIAAVLRLGTLGTLGAVGIGYVVALVSGDDPGGRPLMELLGDGGGAALIGGGLLGLTLIPAGVMAVAAAGFRRRGEGRLVAATLLVFALLLASLAIALVVSPLG